jgi:hypothetical protein
MRDTCPAHSIILDLLFTYAFLAADVIKPKLTCKDVSHVDAEWLSFLLRIQESPNSKHGSVTAFTETLLIFRQVPGKLYDIVLKLATVSSVHVLSLFIIYHSKLHNIYS